MSALSVHLNQAFSTPKAVRKAPGRYVAIRGSVRGDIDKINGLWTVALPGETIRNRYLGDLRAQLADLGFDMLAREPSA